MAKNTDPKKVVTGWDTRWSYCNVWEPRGIDGSRPAWSVSLIIPKSDKETLAKIEKAIQAAYEEGASILKGTGKTVPPLSAINNPLNDGDEKRSGDSAYQNQKYDHYSPDQYPYFGGYSDGRDQEYHRQYLDSRGFEYLDQLGYDQNDDHHGIDGNQNSRGKQYSVHRLCAGCG